MPTANKTSTQKSSPTKKGGNLSKDLANLSVPFGLILAQKSLEKYLTQKPSTKKSTSSKKSTPKKSTPSTKKTTRKTVA